MSWSPGPSGHDQMALSVCCSHVIALTVLFEVQSLRDLWLAGTAPLAPWSRSAGSGLTPGGGGVSGQQSARGEHGDAFLAELWLVRGEGRCKTADSCRVCPVHASPRPLHRQRGAVNTALKWKSWRQSRIPQVHTNAQGSLSSALSPGYFLGRQIIHSPVFSDFQSFVAL